MATGHLKLSDEPWGLRSLWGLFWFEPEIPLVRVKLVHLCAQIATVWCANLHSHAVLQPMKMAKINVSLWSIAVFCSRGHLLSPLGNSEERYSSITLYINSLCTKDHYPDIQCIGLLHGGDCIVLISKKNAIKPRRFGPFYTGEILPETCEVLK